MATQTPKPVPRPTAKVRVRNLGAGRSAGVPVEANHHHTSFRLDPDDRRLLRELTRRRYKRWGVKGTMSAMIRKLIRDACEQEGIR